MTEDVIPENVRNFIFQHIDSVAYLEGLLLVRAESTILWTAITIGGRLYISEKESANLLNLLAARNFMTQVSDIPEFRYQKQSEELEDTIEALAKFYAQYLVPVTNLVHSKSKLKIQEFADAFRIRKE